MSVIITKAVDKLKPVTFLVKARARWVTLVDRAANATPWVRKGDENALSMDDLENEGGLINDLQGKARKKKLQPPDETTEDDILNLSEKGDNEMAGEVIQAIIGPIDKDLSGLKEIMDEEQFKLLTTEKAEKHDDVISYVQVPAEKFEKLDVVAVEDTGYKIIYGKLKEGEAQKGDPMIGVPTPFAPAFQVSESPAEDNMRPFQYVLGDKCRALQSQICNAIALKSDYKEIQDTAFAALDDFTTTLSGLLDQVAANSGWTNTGATKGDDDKPSPGLVERVRTLFRRSPENKGAAQKGETNMEVTKEMIAEVLKEAGPMLAAEAAKAAALETVAELAQKSDSEEEAKAKADAEAALAAEKAEFVDKLDTCVEYIKAKKAEEEKAAKGEGEEEPDAVKEANEKIAVMEAQLAELKGVAAKMESLIRSPGKPSKPEDKKPVKGGVEGEALKGDAAFAVFDEDGGMFTRH